MAENERPIYWLPVEHSMLRRNQRNDYHKGKKAYMVTLHIQDMVPLLGQVEESADPALMAQCRLSALGEAMRQAWLTLPQRFMNISVHDSADEYVIMPEHFHGIIYVTADMQEHLGDVVRLFKARVAMSYRRLLTQGGIQAVGMAKEWLRAYQALPAPQQADARLWVEEQLTLLYSATRCGTQLRDGGPQQKDGQDGPQLRDGGPQPKDGQGGPKAAGSPIRVTASGKHVKTGFLFGTGYTDSLLLDVENLEGHRTYILNNPLSRWMRSNNRQLLRTNRNGIDTAVTVPALMGYLRRVCHPRDLSEEKMAAIRSLLLLDTVTAGPVMNPPGGDGGRAAGPAMSPPGGDGGRAVSHIVCHSYGDRGLLGARLLPVVCHRKDARVFAQQMACCMREAASGAVLVSACISPREREILNAAMEAGYPVVRIVDNGFPEIFHPSQDDIDLCAARRLLLLTPWLYHYRYKDDAIYVAYCKTMNCVAQALCRQNDEWWTSHT